DLPRGGRVSAHLLRAGDTMVYRDADDGSLLSGYGSSYGWVTWESAPDARLRQRTVASIGRLTWTRDADMLDRDVSGKRVPSGAGRGHEPAAQRLVAAARGHDAPRGVGTLHAVAGARVDPGAGRRDGARAHRAVGAARARPGAGAPARALGARGGLRPARRPA